MLSRCLVKRGAANAFLSKFDEAIADLEESLKLRQFDNVESEAIQNDIKHI